MDNKPDWAAIQSDIFDLVLQKLSFADRFRSRGVCKTWRSNIKIHISSLLKNTQSKPTLLMLPNNEITEGLRGLCLVDIVETKLFRSNKDLSRKFDQGFIGSTKGWLVFNDQGNERLEFFNPFLDVGFKTILPKLFNMTKFALWSFPILGDYNNYGIVSFYEYSIGTYHIAYAKCGDENWSYLADCTETSYCDIVCRNHLVYALSKQCHVEAWDFRSIIPRKRMCLTPDPPQESNDELQNFHRAQFYLIVSNGELLLVQRYVGYYICNNNGSIVSEAAIEDYNQGRVSFQYLTKSFYVFKLDLIKMEWVRVDDLGDRVIFLGGNESILVQSGDLKEFEKNSIYFTDDFWDDIKIVNYYGGHDNGIYRMKDRSIELLSNSWKIHPTPFWDIPNSM